jgi:uncharacterized membrane protein YphA (DoxX/SURF4 family)
MFNTNAPSSVVLVRVLVGWVFLSEGIQKFLFPQALGVGRFTKIGIPAPQVMAPFVGTVEIVCGSLILLGLLTHLAAIPLLIDMAVAIISTKIPILLGHGFLGFSGPAGASGFWAMLHEARTDFSMVLGLLFLLINGGGRFSVDARVTQGDAAISSP